MNKLGKAVFVHDYGNVVHAVVLRDKSSRRVSVDIYVEYADGSMSDITTISRRDICTKRSCFDFLYDMDGGFGRDDIDKIKIGIIDILNDDNGVESIQGKATMEELHKAVSAYVYENAEELSDNPDADVFIEGGFGYILTQTMDLFAKKYRELGYTRLGILKRLKIMGALQNGKNRAYDILVYVGGRRRHFYKIELAEKVLEEEADEVIGNAD